MTVAHVFRSNSPWGLILCALGCACASEQSILDETGNTKATGGDSSSSEGTHTGGTPGSGSASGGTFNTGGAGEDNTGSGGLDGPASGGRADGAGGVVFAGTQPSAGCGHSAGLGSGKVQLDVNGTEREYILSVPENYSSDRAYRLVFGFHGMMYDAEWVANGEEPLTGPYFGLESESEGSAFFVAPQALSGGFSDEGGRDIDFVLAMIEQITADLCVDESRIFATGFSFGGIMTTRIGCELYDVFRAIAPMSASLPSSCANSLPALGYLGTHGEQDNTITLPQGEAVRDSFLARNHCGSTTTPLDQEGCVSYQGCDAGAPVVWCTFTGEHVPAPFAGAVIWEFLSQF